MIRIFSQYVSVKSLLLAVLEGILMAAALVGGVKLRFWGDPAAFEAYTAWPDFALQAFVIVLILQACFYYNDLYDLTAVRGRSDQVLRVGQSLGAACLILGLIYFLAPGLLIGRGIFFITILIIPPSVLVARVAMESAWHATAPPVPTVILGAGQLGLTVARELAQRDDLNMKLLGFVDSSSSSEPPGDRLFGHQVLGTTPNLQEIVRSHGVSRIIVAVDDRRGSLPIEELARLRLQGIHVEDAHTALAALTGRVWLNAVYPSWFVFSDGFRRSRLTDALKRAADLLLGLVGLVLALPLMILVAIAVRLDSRGPILYRQVRVGRKGVCFELLKFRSMRTDAEEENGAQWAQENDPRATRLGRWLRPFRLDELPQFVNVIRGQMSFVGPRPERPIFVDRLRSRIPFYDERHSVRPGLTGWAQIQFPYGASVEDAIRKLEYDLFYLQNLSVAFDCAIVFQTVRIVLFGRGAR